MPDTNKNGQRTLTEKLLQLQWNWQHANKPILGDTIETITIQSITDKSNKTEKPTITRSRTLSNASTAQALDIIKMELHGLYTWVK